MHDDTALFLQDLINALKLEKPVIISPSMSGSYSLPFLINEPEEWADRSKGFVPVAPIFTDKFTEDQYKKCQVVCKLIPSSHTVILV